MNGFDTSTTTEIYLDDNMISAMFQNCTSLMAAPELPATKLVNQCYQYLFEGCTVQDAN